jgi:hypothetical protein
MALFSIQLSMHRSWDTNIEVSYVLATVHLVMFLLLYLPMQASNLPHGSFGGCYDDVLSISSGTLHLSCSSLVPECVDKNCFEEARVLLQLDKKFIPVISGETILLVDQVHFFSFLQGD